MGAPVYPCDMSVGADAIQGRHAACKADPVDGNLGRHCIMSKICLSSYQYLARSQERQICAKLANKGYEPSWKTLEVETLEDWWGLMLVRQYPVGTFLDGKYF